MTADDPARTQRDDAPDVTAELAAAGFEQAEVIGRGGFGVVYRCVQPALDRTVAVKVLTAGLDDDSRARFFREQRAMGRLTGHPNIVTALHVGSTADGRPFIVMPYHARGCLDARIRRSGPLGVEETLHLGVAVAGALETAHRVGVLHRDVKPANILVTDYGEPALTDFGIAHVPGGFETATGVITGSPAFTAPEVLSGMHPTVASDVYGLGATLFCAITGHAAYERRSGERLVAQFLRISTQPIPDLREDGVPDELSAVIERAMSANPRSRPASAAELADDLRRIQLHHGLPVDDIAVPSAAGGAGADGDRAVPDTRAAPGPAALPSTPRHTPGGLPRELTTFVGRHRELAAAADLLSASSLVTLTGPGGVGKTRLALRVAADVGPRFRDGVRLVELAQLRDESLVIDVVAAELGLRDRSARPRYEVLMEYLGARELLLVLDNCEQVVQSVALLVDPLLQACPALSVLATSREVLGVGGESTLRIAPLPVPDRPMDADPDELMRCDAVSLFADRAAATVPGFTITESNRVAVASICSRLDGLPLAIELAAARLRAMSVEQVLQRLTDRFALLTHGARGSSTRQQTLRCCVDWSYELCTPAEQELWTALSVFAGGVELDAVEAVCGGEGAGDDLLDLLTALVDKSILSRQDSGTAVRFRMLDTLRDHGREKVRDTGRVELVRQRHLDWCVALTRTAEADWVTDRQLEWIGRLRREQANLREAMEFGLSVGDQAGAESALRIATALFPFWLARGSAAEGRRWLERALAGGRDLPPALRAKALYACNALTDRMGDVGAAARLLDAVRAPAVAGADPLAGAYAALAEGNHALYGGDLERAHTALTDAVDVFRDRGDTTAVVAALMLHGWVHALRGDDNRALACHDEALAITQSHGESVYRTYVLWAIAVITWRGGRLARARNLLEHALVLSHRSDDPLMAAACLEALAWIACGEGEGERAAAMLGAADARARAVGSSPFLFPTMAADHEECERNTRRTLGPRRFEAARRAGALLGFAAAVRFALGMDPEGGPLPPGAVVGLTRRERQVADLAARGLPTAAIAAELGIARPTARKHVQHVVDKLGLASRAQIAERVAGHPSGPPA
ncbi:hypothetical protein GCM10023094_51840 [Rhodococcus olei]|uniref:Non-specific serine/threonine protein kinase n=1 Tax=Rhodococcus olei TaxID=2161675 RepID=A0ABP8PQK5_9NOCA